MNFNKMLQFRRMWMAIAIILIVFYHTWYDSNISIIDIIRKSGYCGVDIFLFASGIGCYFSYNANNDTLQFLKRRFIKLMPTYWVYIIVWLIYNKSLKFEAIIGNIFAIQAFSNRSSNEGYIAFNWYISAIWIMYLLTPLFYKIIASAKNKIASVFLIVPLLICTIPFWNDDQLLIMVTRIPIFYFGMWFANYYNKNDSCFNWMTYCVYAFAAALGGIVFLYSLKHFNNVIWDNGFAWYPFLLITPFVCMAISRISAMIFEFKSMNVIINFIMGTVGNSTFEIYLTHILIIDLFFRLENNGSLKLFPYWIINMFVIVSIILSVLVLRYITKIVMKSIICIKEK